MADIFDFPHTAKIDPQDILTSFHILFIRAKILRSEGKWAQARIIYYEVLTRMLALIDNNQLSAPLPESTLSDILDDYEEASLSDPHFDEQKDEIQNEVRELLQKDSSELEGITLEQLVDRLGID